MEARARMDVLVHDIRQNRHATGVIKVNVGGNVESSTRDRQPFPCIYVQRRVVERVRLQVKA